MVNNLDSSSSNLNNNEPGLRGNMGVFALAMTALAFVAPLGGASGALPAFLSLGGSGTALIFVLVTVLLLVFSAGFTKMGVVMARPGGFYAYVSDGLGKKLGFVTAGMAGVGYLLVGCWAPPLMGIMVNNFLGNVFGIGPAPWVVWAILVTLLSMFFAYRRIDLSARIMVIVMLCEAIAVVIFDIFCFAKGLPMNGSSAIPTGIVDNGQFGAAVLMVLGAFFGFEATVIYREETKDPARTMPKAVYTTVILLGVFWVLTASAYTAYWGNDNIEQMANDHMGTIFNDTLLALTNKIVMDVVSIFAMVSVFASQLSIHNVAARYWYSMGVDGALPKIYGKAHPKHHSPYAGAVTIGLVWVALMTVFYIVRPNAPDLVYPMFSGTGTFFVTVNLFMVSIAVMVYFRKNKIEGVTSWQSTIGPIISTIGIGAIMILAVIHFEALLGSSGWATYAFVAFVIIVFVGCYIYASYLEKNKPDVYARLGRSNPDTDA